MPPFFFFLKNGSASPHEDRPAQDLRTKGRVIRANPATQLVPVPASWTFSHSLNPMGHVSGGVAPPAPSPAPFNWLAHILAK